MQTQHEVCKPSLRQCKLCVHTRQTLCKPKMLHLVNEDFITLATSSGVLALQNMSPRIGDSFGKGPCNDEEQGPISVKQACPIDIGLSMKVTLRWAVFFDIVVFSIKASQHADG